MVRRQGWLVGWMAGILALGGMGTAGAQVPAGWSLAGSHPELYTAGRDPDQQRSGKASAFLRRGEPGGGFGTLLQYISAEAYRGKRVRLSADVKASGVRGWAGLWLRVDGFRSGQPLAFDNMGRRPIQGTSDWTRHEVVLDVVQDARLLVFGLLLSGPGQVWLDGVALEEVDASVPVTDLLVDETLPKEPTNLDFEDPRR